MYNGWNIITRTVYMVYQLQFVLTLQKNHVQFLPVLRILAKCAVCRTKINDENVFVAYIFALLAPTALYSLQDRVTSMNHNISWLHRVLPMSFNIFTSQWLLY